MAAKRRYDPPNVQLVRLLREAREEGLGFDAAWDRALRPGRSLVMSNSHRAPHGALQWPTDRTDRLAWQEALRVTRPGYRKAYERVPPRRSEVALRVLADCLGGGDPAAVLGGIGDGGGLASAA